MEGYPILTELDAIPTHELVGQSIMIYPQGLINRKRLFTTQVGLDYTKVGYALDGKPDIAIDPPKGWISLEKSFYVVTIGDGNHRTGMAAIYSQNIPVLIKGVWQGGERYGFNMIVQKLKAELNLGDVLNY